jgi:hypothetical protein
MKKLARSLPFALLLLGCGGGNSYTVEIENQSAKRLDSVHVFINASVGDEPTVKSGSLLPGEAMPPLSVGEIFGGGNNAKTTAAAIFYAADTVIKSTMPHNGITGADGHYKATIDSGLQVTWKVWN